MKANIVSVGNSKGIRIPKAMLNLNMENNKLSPGRKAKKTGQWAKTMTKWLITLSSKGRKKWQFVSFEGPKGGESRGIVDFIAIRRDHKYRKNPLKIGDLFEIIIIQAKGGSAPMPSNDDILRLSKVGEYYHAKHIILADWQKGKAPTLYSLVNSSWEKTEPKDVFK
ncbi:MAG TPA: hypothetical protein DCQ99_06160 [Nitrospinae bacterium]|nr:hypothetical protein [Nitrospinota bacterium]HBA27474.1 hypothetical protein [Nitrospinota bacterium]